MSELEVQAEALLDQLCREFPIGYRPVIHWKRLRVTAGQAFFKTGTIALSSLVITDDERLELTLKHEYAHLMAYARHGRRGVTHGEPWKAAMRELGLVPKVRHTYEVARNQARQEVSYECKRCGKTFTRKRVLPKRRHYVHANCGGALKLQFKRKLT